MKFCPVCGTEYADEIRFCQRDGQTLRASNPGGDLVGQVIADRYHISKKLGEGGMGAVYLAEHVKMGRQSAIKVMGSGMSHDPEAISRFNREAANASRINHPNVCAVYDFGETEDGTIYLAMEFVEGHTLSGLLKDTGPLPLPRAVDLLRQTADALQAAHDLGIVHRDLKPDNIMIVNTRGRDVVKVVDFGIAKAAGGEAGQNVTKTGLVVGTPEYMSPEQLSGDKVDGRSDIYSLALVFYRTITDTLPFIADTAQETMIKRLTDEPIPLAVARPGSSFPPALQTVMDRALARWPQDRYSTAAEFAADAARAIEGLKAAAATATEAKTQVVRPSDLTNARTAAIPATRVSSPQKERKVSPVMIGAGVVVLALAGGGFVMRDTLFGGVPASPAGDSTSLMAGTPGDSVQPLSNPGSDSAGGTRTNPGDTAVRQVGTQPPPRTPNTQAQTQNPADTGRAPVNNPPALDLAALRTELTQLEDDAIEAAGRRPAIRTRAEEIYRDRDVPSVLRGRAAFAIYLTYFNSSRFPEARTWLDHALSMNPGNSAYSRADDGLKAVYNP